MDEDLLDNGRESIAIDWQDIRQRIADAEAALEGLEEASPEMLQRAWARRAERLAAKPAQDDLGEQVELVLARLGRELYGLDAQHVFDIRPAEQITRVPRVPDWVSGVTNLRGRILSVVDLRRFFGLPRAEGGMTGQDVRFLIVVETPEMEIALLADEVLNVEAIPINQIQETTGTVRGLRPEYVRGVAQRNNRDDIQSQQEGHEGTESGDRTGNGTGNGMSDVLIILDLPALLADERLIVHEETV